MVKRVASWFFWKALWVLSVQANGLLTLLRSCMGLIRLENMSYLICSYRGVSRNCLIHTKRPMRLCNSFFDVGGFISLMARAYSRSALNPLMFTMCLRNFAFDVRKVHLSGFRLSEFAESNEELSESVPRPACERKQIGLHLRSREITSGRGRKWWSPFSTLTGRYS